MDPRPILTPDGHVLSSLSLEQFFSSFLRLFNPAPHVVVTPTITLFLVLLHNCDFATIIKHKDLICRMVLGDARERVI